MRKTITLLTILLLIVFMVGCENAVNPTISDTPNLDLAKSDGETMLLAKGGGCPTIQGGTIVYSAGHFFEGQPITTGFDDFGYNYQGHMYKGLYFNSYAGSAGFAPWKGEDDQYLLDNPGADEHETWPYRDIKLAMKWNDAWIANTDCGTQPARAEYTDPNTPDGKLDRHYGYDSYDNSGAWLTNHQSGDNYCGGKKPWNYFVKIITPSTNNGDVKIANVWYDADGVEIGPAIWGAFAIILQVSNDECLEEHGQIYKSPKSAGFGAYPPFDIE